MQSDIYKLIIDVSTKTMELAKEYKTLEEAQLGILLAMMTIVGICKGAAVISQNIDEGVT